MSQLPQATGPAFTPCPAPKLLSWHTLGLSCHPWLGFSFCRSEHKLKTTVLKQPPQSSGLPQTQWHLLSSVKASAELFFLLRAEHLRTSCRRKKKPGSFHPLSFQNVLHASTAASKPQLLEGRQLWGEAQCQPDGPCPGDTSCPGRELRPGTARCWPPTCTASGCINPRTCGQVCRWTGTRTGTDTTTTAPDGDCIPPQHAHN